MHCMSLKSSLFSHPGSYKIFLSSVLMAARFRAYVYDCCDATKTSPVSNLLATYVKEISSIVTELWVIEFVS